ncbi:hypothetical protein BJ742DRAFT_770981 [Cladochytrium replicatum]|nr:hypothetical protein BJ742DRAFT_770981 [Cladochytrium replicatum]
MSPVMATSDGRGKDYKLKTWTSPLGGRVILSKADLTLVYGRRYDERAEFAPCLFGKSGIGKSILLRSIASDELVLPPHIKALHVQQEVHGVGP